MAVAIESSGTQVCTVTTEHELGAPATAKTRVIKLDLNAAALGDEFELRIKSKVLAAGTVREWKLYTFKHSYAQPVVETPPLACPNGCTVTLKQTLGTSRSIPWAIETLD